MNTMMQKNFRTISVLLLLLIATTSDVTAGRGGAVAGGVLGGLAVGSIIGSAAASRNAYASNEDYINALENQNDRLRDENADLRAELRLRQSNNRQRNNNGKRSYAR